MEPYLKCLARLFMQQQAAELPHMKVLKKNKKHGSTTICQRLLCQFTTRTITAYLHGLSNQT